MEEGRGQTHVVREATRSPALADPADGVRAFYESHPYPAPIYSLDRHRELYRNPDRRRAASLLLWPTEKPRANRDILIAGCGTSQAAIHALREPDARVTAIDISETSLRHTRDLQQKYGLRNLDLHRLAIEQVGELGLTFDQIVCTGVLHHLADPDTGLRALRNVLAPGGAMHLMVYAAYGRAGIYMMQDYCRLLGLGATEAELHDLGATIGCAVFRPSDRRRGEAGQGFHATGRARRCAASPSRPRLYRAAALCLVGALRTIVRALVRAGSLSPAMRGNREDATCRASRLAFAAIAARRGRVAARNHGQAQLHRLSRRSPRREPADHLRWRCLAGIRSFASAVDLVHPRPGAPRFRGRPDQSGPHLPRPRPPDRCGATASLSRQSTATALSTRS